jgi:hypothetical protein
MRLAGCKSEMDRQAVGVHYRVNLTGQAASRAAYVLVIVLGHACPVLVHTDDGGINHLQRRVMTGSQRIHDQVPGASPPPPNEAIVTGGTGSVAFREVAPWRTRAQNPKDAIEHATVIYPTNAAWLVGQHRFDGDPCVVADS